METNYRTLFEAARKAGAALADTSVERLSEAVRAAAGELRIHTAEILAANVEDLAAMDPSSPLCDRLRLTPERIAAIAADM